MATSTQSVLVGVVLSVGCTASGAAAAEPVGAAAAASLVLACQADNDLWRVLRAAGVPARRCENAAEAVAAAAEGAGVLALADGYPDRPTVVEPALFDEARRKRLRLYLEYPAALPDLAAGPPREARLERGVVVSAGGFFGAGLPPMSLVAVHGCRYVPVAVDSPHLVLAKVAGVDTAVFGLQEAPAAPLLFEHPRGGLLVATTKLSHFVTGRYQPQAAWAAIWQAILAWLQPGRETVPLQWTATVRPTYGPLDELPADAETAALRRAGDWIRRSRCLRHPAWPQEVLDRALRYNTVREMPAADWPPGDGSLGVLEGFSSTILADGSQPMRYAVRNDCTTEVAMLLACDAVVNGRPDQSTTAANLLSYVFLESGLAAGPRADPASPSFGLIGWALDHPGSYWGDDNARGLLAVGTVSALLAETRWNDAIARGVLANLRTTGRRGFRESCVTEEALQAKGWRAYWTDRSAHLSPHFQSWSWCCFLWAYQQTRFAPLLERSRAGLRALMAAYPQRWDWCLRSGTIERARLLLPLAWLVRVEDTPEHRRWLRRIAGDVIALQDASGGIREVIGDGGPGIHSNAEYGTRETSLIQADGDPVCDLLYSCNFALIGLHEAATATGDPDYARAEERLAHFLCRIQVRSPEHTELEGAWYRAFHLRRWEFWASNADWEWGPWCTETGWGAPWIGATLALRRQPTSLWDLVQRVDLRPAFARWRPEMLPDDALAADPGATVAHVAVGRLARLAADPDPRYPGEGAASLTDGRIGSPDYRDPEWLGFWGQDLEATLDLGDTVEIHTLALSSLLSTRLGIFLPPQVEFAVSQDGERFQVAGTATNVAPTEHQPPAALRQTVEGLAIRARYVRVRAKNLGTLPPWIARDRLAAWLFVDELLVNPTPSAASR